MRIPYKCLHCRKTFSIKEHFAKRCPYCGSEQLEDYKNANDAQSLLDRS